MKPNKLTLMKRLKVKVVFTIMLVNLQMNRIHLTAKQERRTMASKMFKQRTATSLPIWSVPLYWWLCCISQVTTSARLLPSSLRAGDQEAHGDPRHQITTNSSSIEKIRSDESAVVESKYMN